MNESESTYHKRAIRDYGQEVSTGISWFVDAGRVFYGTLNPTGDVSDYITGFISRSTFVMDYTSSSDELDITSWKTFLSDLDLTLLDAR